MNVHRKKTILSEEIQVQFGRPMPMKDAFIYDMVQLMNVHKTIKKKIV